MACTGNGNKAMGPTHVLNKKTDSQKSWNWLSPLVRDHVEYANDHAMAIDVTEDVLPERSFEVEVLGNFWLGIGSFLHRTRWEGPIEIRESKIAHYFASEVINRTFFFVNFGRHMTNIGK